MVPVAELGVRQASAAGNLKLESRRRVTRYLRTTGDGSVRWNCSAKLMDSPCPEFLNNCSVYVMMLFAEDTGLPFVCYTTVSKRKLSQHWPLSRLVAGFLVSGRTATACSVTQPT